MDEEDEEDEEEYHYAYEDEEAVKEDEDDKRETGKMSESPDEDKTLQEVKGWSIQSSHLSIKPRATILPCVAAVLSHAV